MPDYFVQETTAADGEYSAAELLIQPRTFAAAPDMLDGEMTSPTWLRSFGLVESTTASGGGRTTGQLWPTTTLAATVVV